MSEVVALRRALDVLEAQAGIDPHRIAYVGHDFGAMYGALLVAVDPRPRYAVFVAPGLSFWEWFLLGEKPADPAAYLREMAPFDLPPWLGRAQVAGSLLQLGERDPYVAASSAQVFFTSLPAHDRERKTYATGHAVRDPAGHAAADRRAWLLSRLTR